MSEENVTVVIVTRDGERAAEALRGLGGTLVGIVRVGDEKGFQTARGLFRDTPAAIRAFEGLCSAFGGTKTSVEVHVGKKKVRVAYLGPGA